MQLDTLVMSAFALFIFLGYAVYAFFMFVAPTRGQRRLEAGWTFEPSQTTRRQYGLDVEDEIIKMLAGEIKMSYKDYKYHNLIKDEI